LADLKQGKKKRKRFGCWRADILGGNVPTYMSFLPGAKMLSTIRSSKWEIKKCEEQQKDSFRTNQTIFRNL
jgi:hypothetical protein